MANQEHLDLLRQGVDCWNDWRKNNSALRPDLRGANLSSANLGWADLRGVNLISANLSWANLSRADLRAANLRGANLSWVNLSRADLNCTNLCKTNLRGANLGGTNFGGADLREADLTGANLWCAQLSGTNLENANLSECLIYGISAWHLKLEGTRQWNLVISRADEPTISVDNLEVAQFIGLLLNNRNIRHVVNTITSQAVLILGCFNVPERKQVLDNLRDELRQHDYLPIVCDLDKPSIRHLTETISSLALIVRFIIADFTEPESILQELRTIIPNMRSVPMQPILHASARREYPIFDYFRQYPWVLEACWYDNSEKSLASLNETMILPAEAKARELTSVFFDALSRQALRI